MKTATGFARGLALLLLVMLGLCGPTLAPAQEPTPAERAVFDSDWDFVIDGNQKGGMRIREGVIYPGHPQLNNPVGRAVAVGPETVSLTFLNHPKISGGEGTMTKTANRRWEGPLYHGGLERSVVYNRGR